MTTSIYSELKPTIIDLYDSIRFQLALPIIAYTLALATKSKKITTSLNLNVISDWWNFILFITLLTGLCCIVAYDAQINTDIHLARTLLTRIKCFLSWFLKHLLKTSLEMIIFTIGLLLVMGLHGFSLGSIPFLDWGLFLAVFFQLIVFSALILFGIYSFDHRDNFIRFYAFSLKVRLSCYLVAFLSFSYLFYSIK